MAQIDLIKVFGNESAETFNKISKGYSMGKKNGINQCLEIVQKIRDEHIDSNFIYPINYGTLCRIIIKLERLINE